MDADEVPGKNYRPGYEAVAERLVEFIVQKNLHTGDRLPTELELGKQLGVSRAMVREAIKLLSARGHVRTRRGSGIFVGDGSYRFAQTSIDLSMPVDHEHMLALFEFRSIQEMHTARLAAERITVSELRALEKLVEQNWHGAELGQWDVFIEADIAFHQAIANASHNQFLAETVASTFRLQRWAINLMTGSAPGSLRVSAEQHATILAAIKAGDPAGAAQAMQMHVSTVCDDYQQEMRHLLADYAQKGK